MPFRRVETMWRTMRPWEHPRRAVSDTAITTSCYPAAPAGSTMCLVLVRCPSTIIFFSPGGGRGSPLGDAEWRGRELLARGCSYPSFPSGQSDRRCRYRTGSARRVLRIVWPTSGIVDNVLADAIKRGVVANNVLVIATLPKASPQPSCAGRRVSVDRSRHGQRLESAHESRQCCRGGPLRPPWGGVRVAAAVPIDEEQDGMKMVWHDDECVEIHIGAMGRQFVPRILHNPPHVAETDDIAIHSTKQAGAMVCA